MSIFIMPTIWEESMTDKQLGENAVEKSNIHALEYVCVCVCVRAAIYPTLSPQAGSDTRSFEVEYC